MLTSCVIPIGFGQGRQKLLPWLLSVPLHCLQASIAHASPGIWFPGCKDLSEVVFAVQCDAGEEEPVLQGMPKDGEGVVGIL